MITQMMEDFKLHSGVHQHGQCPVDYPDILQPTLIA